MCVGALRAVENVYLVGEDLSEEIEGSERFKRQISYGYGMSFFITKTLWSGSE